MTGFWCLRWTITLNCLPSLLCHKGKAAERSCQRPQRATEWVIVLPRSSRCMKSHFCKASFLMSAMVLLAFNGQKVDQTDWEETGRWQVVGGTLSEMDQNKQNGRSRACSMCSDNGLKWVTKLWGQQTCIKYIIMFWCLEYCHGFFFLLLL